MTKHIYKGKQTIEYEIDYGISDMTYSKSLDILHPEITWFHETVGSYQGDIISIGYDKDNVWYYKCNSYGSCSGCDWLEGIYTEEEATDFFKKQEVLDKIGSDTSKLKEYLAKELINNWQFERQNLEHLYDFIDKVQLTNLNGTKEKP